MIDVLKEEMKEIQEKTIKNLEEIIKLFMNVNKTKKTNNNNKNTNR